MSKELHNKEGHEKWGSPKVFKVIGGPGTGKTTRVVGNPEHGIKGLFMKDRDRFDFHEQMLVTYTNAGVDEASERLYNMMDVYKYEVEERVTTIHSRCFQTLDLDRNQVVRWKHRNRFCERYDLTFEYDDEDDDIMSAELAEGNALFKIYEWLANNRIDTNDWTQCPIEWNDNRDIEWLFERWEEYKDDENLMEFHDMVEDTVALARKQLENLGWGIIFPDEDTTDREIFEMARKDAQRQPDVIRGEGAFVDTKKLYVDECQDLDPLQWDWYLAQKLVCDEVVLGFDDDQCIYEWSGADPSQVLDEEGEFEVLEETYRIPSHVWNVCNGVIQQVDKRQPKNIKPAGEGGTVHFYERPAGRELVKHMIGDKSVFILFRARYMINDFTNEVLHPNGIPYDNMSTYETWSNDVVGLRDALGKLHNRKKLTGKDVNNLKTFYDGDVEFDYNRTQDVMDSLGGLSAEKVINKFNLSSYSSNNPIKMYLDNSIDDINYYQEQAIKGNIRKGLTHLYPEQVRIGTIHSAKGKEADTVIIATDSTKRILSNMAEDTRKTDKYISDAERRVYYVGMTRAKEELVLAEGVIDTTHVIPLEYLLKNYSPKYNRPKQQTLTDQIDAKT